MSAQHPDDCCCTVHPVCRSERSRYSGKQERASRIEEIRARKDRWAWQATEDIEYLLDLDREHQQQGAYIAKRYETVQRFLAGEIDRDELADAFSRSAVSDA